jgi:fatty-acyl-CoA synthase
MIISGGVNIYPLEVENTLMQIPHVMDVAVLGVPHMELGEEVVAVIELKDGVVADDHTASELIAFCKSRIASFKCPKRIIFMQDMPRLPNGKLLKRELLTRIS